VVLPGKPAIFAGLKVCHLIVKKLIIGNKDWDFPFIPESLKLGLLPFLIVFVKKESVLCQEKIGNF